MKKILIGLSTGMALLFGTVIASAAGLGVGLSGHFLQVEADGSEKTNTSVGSETTTKSVSSDTFIGSIYSELTFGENNGWAFGVEAIPGAADVSDATHSRADTETSVTGIVTSTSNSVTHTAAAEVEDFWAIYAEMPIGPFYIRAGRTQIDVNTLEAELANGGSYANATLNGTQLGIGMKGVRENLRWKIGYEINDWDTLSIISTGNSVAAETNTLTADLDTRAAKFSLGLQF